MAQTTDLAALRVALGVPPPPPPELVDLPPWLTREGAPPAPATDVTREPEPEPDTEEVNADG